MKRMLDRVVSEVERLSRERTGDVLMEYVLLSILIILPMVGASTYLYNPSGVTFDVEGALGGADFGMLGNMFVDLYRMVMSGLCLPLP